MARLVLGVAGAAAGFALGGPTGAQWGWMAGSTIGGLLTTTDRKVTIDEGGMQTTEEGAPLAIPFGTTACTGNVIHAYPVRKIEETTSGKGGGDVRAQSVTMLRTYAIEMCEGKVAALIQVKQAGEVVYDARPEGELSAEDNQAFLARCTIYLGDEDQLPDPSLEAIEGVGNVPAYRGTAYIVFADDDVTATGGSVPQYEFVVAQSATTTVHHLPKLTYADLDPEGGIFGSGVSPGAGIDIEGVTGTGTDGRAWLIWVSLESAFVQITRTVQVFVNDGLMHSQVITIGTGVGAYSHYRVQLNNLLPGSRVRVLVEHGWTYGSAFVGSYHLKAAYHAKDASRVTEYTSPEFGVMVAADGSLCSAPSLDIFPWGPDLYTETVIGHPVPLSDIVATIHERCGHVPADYDVSELTDLVDGLTLASAGYTGADAINTLRTPYFFDRAEWGGKIRYPKRGKPVVATLTVDDLVEEPDESERADPVTYPRKLHLKYQSAALNYEVTQATQERISPDVRVVGESTIEVPVVLTTEAAQLMVAKLHKVAQADAEAQVKISVTDQWLRLVAADTIGLVLRGITRRLRIAQIDDADGVRALTCSLDRQSAYTANVTVIEPPAPTPPTGRYPGETQLAVLDIAALTDDMDAMGYAVATSGERAAWRGALVQRSTDAGATYADVVTTDRAGVLGTLLAPVPAASPWYTDTTNSVRVQLTRTTQELGSISDLAFLQRGGGFALESADGSWELLQCLDAVDEGDGIYTLSTLHRGQLNSGATAHAVGAQFVLLASVVPATALSAWLGMDLTHRATSLGLSPDGAPTQTRVYVGRQQQEWPVASLQAGVVGGTLTASWAPRHRFGTDLAPVASLYFRGFRVTVADAASHTETFDSTDTSLARDVSALVAPITVTVAALNAYTGAGQAVSKTAS